jgi:hypothetical protein
VPRPLQLAQDSKRKDTPSRSVSINGRGKESVPKEVVDDAKIVDDLRQDAAARPKGSYLVPIARQSELTFASRDARYF